MDWDELHRRIKGKVISPKNQNFVTTREAMVWNNIKPNRSPDVIVIVEDENDVIESINFARENNLKVVVHGGGHTWCGLAIRNGGMTIDLSKLNAVSIDKQNKKAIIQPVISNQELAFQLGKQNLAFPVGHCPTVKASGYLLNGGMSWNMGHWGPACLSIEAIDFITADGKKLKASAEENQDLFWAARGCGPGMFAIATRYYLKCYDLPQAIMSSTYFYSLNDLKEVVEEVTTLGWTMPDNVELSIFLIKAPPELAEQCKNNNGMICMIAAVVFAETESEGIKALNILEEGKMPDKSLSKILNERTNFSRLAELSGAAWPENHRNLVENQCSKANPVDILMAIREKFIESPSPKSVIVFCQSTGGHNLLQPYADIALSMDASSYGGIWTIWEEAKDDEVNTVWHKEMATIINQFTSEHYIGETDIVENNERVKKSYSPEKWQRLETIRAKYDPHGLFFGYLGGIPKSKE